DRLPLEVGHTILAVARDAGQWGASGTEEIGAEADATEVGAEDRTASEGWALLLRDVSTSLLPSRFEAITSEENAALLEGIAALHATFFAEEATLKAAPYLCAPARYYTALAPETGRRELGATPVAERILPGWEKCLALVSPDVARVVTRLHADPTPLCNALARYPQTLVHGDLRRANLALVRRMGEIGETLAVGKEAKRGWQVAL